MWAAVGAVPAAGGLLVRAAAHTLGHNLPTHILTSLLYNVSSYWTPYPKLTDLPLWQLAAGLVIVAGEGRVLG